MLYVHSFSPVELDLFNKLAQDTSVSQISTERLQDIEYVEKALQSNSNETLLYSFQKLEHYSHISSFQQEIAAVKKLLNVVQESNIKQLVLISYPGVYINSDNLFLQHKAMVEQMFLQAGIPCTILNVQGINNPSLQIHNLQNLFYNESENQYLIPKKSSIPIYSITTAALAKIILRSIQYQAISHYDAFDTLSDLAQFIKYNSSDKRIVRLYPVYLQCKSFLGLYPSINILDLFLRPTVPMHNYRTQKELNIDVNHIEILDDNEKRKSINTGLMEHSMPIHISPIFS